MKRRLIALLLCFAMVLPIIPANAAAEDDFTIYHDGTAVTSITLPQHEKLQLKAEGEQTSGYQWQIHVSGEVWADISGANSSTIELTYAMVANLLINGTVKVRCKANVGGSTIVTDEVAVSVDYYDAPTAEVTVEEPVVMQNAVAIEGPVISEPEKSDDLPEEQNSEDLNAAIANAEAKLVATSDEWDAAEADYDIAVAEAEAKETAAEEAEAAAAIAVENADAAAEAAEAEGATEEELQTAATAAEEAKAAEDAAVAARAAADEAAATVATAAERVEAAETAYFTADAELAAVMEKSGAVPLVATFSNDVLMAAENDVSRVHVITINYYLRNTTTAVADPYLAEAMEGKSFSMTVKSPEVVGYTPDTTEYVIDISEVTGPANYTVYYDPANVGFTVNHYQQNVALTDYELKETVKHEGLTGETIGDVHKTYEGFTYLLYKRPQVAADGSTIVDVKYDRKYTLVNFDLGGGYGVDPIYAPYGSAIGNVDTPKRAGYTFKGWSLDGTNVVDLPSTVPAEKVTYIALWEATDQAKVTIVIWGENADDEDYSYIKTVTTSAKPGDEITFEDVRSSVGSMDTKLWSYAESDAVTVAADGTTVMNVYYDRKTFTLTFKDGRSTVYTLTEKWGADISEHWPIKGTNGTTYDNGERWDPSGSDIYDEVLVYLDIMPAESFTLSVSRKDYDTFIMHYMVEALPGAQNTVSYRYNGTTKLFVESFSVTANYNYVTEAEDFFDLDGFTQWTSNPEFSRGQIDIPGGGDVYFYYSRNTYQLDFYSGNGIIKTESSVYYEEPLGGYDFTPDSAPDIYEKGSVVFDGWYLNPECSGDEYVLDEHTMPADNMILYAKWAPVQHKVKIFLTEENADSNIDQLGETQIVDHRTTAVEPKESDVVNPISPDYKFVGWFYKDENGVEKAFDFSMGVTKDLVLYAKWSSDVEKEFTVYYKLAGTNTDVAAPTTGKGIVDNSETFDAKVGDELYDAYQVGFFPDALSKSITLSIMDPDSQGANSLTFWYTETTVPYTVKYLDKVTGEPVAPEKVVENNKKAHVIETFVQVSGKLPDAYQKSLTLVAGTTAKDNVIIFYYAADENRAYYAHTHWTQDANGVWQRVGYSDNIGNVGEVIASDPITIDGYTYDASLTEVVVGDSTSKYTAPVELTSAGLEIKHYYVEHEITINYVAVGPEGATDFGSVTPESEKVKHITGLAGGSTAQPGDAYKLVGWYSDPECTQQISTDAKYVPSKPSAGWVDGTTFYALFDYNLTTMTIKKEASKLYNSDDTFIFRVEGNGESFLISMKANGSGVTISNIVVGTTYTITELTSGSRYTPDAVTKSCTAKVSGSDNVVTFMNKLSNDKWLGDTDSETNVFNPVAN